MVLQVADEDIERMVETVKVKDTSLKFRVERRMPRCYKCGLKSHIRADCPPPFKKDEGGEKVVGVPLLVEVEEGTHQTRSSTSIEEEEKNNTWKTVRRERKRKK